MRNSAKYLHNLADLHYLDSINVQIARGTSIADLPTAKDCALARRAELRAMLAADSIARIARDLKLARDEREIRMGRAFTSEESAWFARPITSTSER